MIGLDTCTIIDLFQGDDNLIELIKFLDEEVCLSKTSYFELVFGINPRNKKHLNEEKYYDKIFQNLKVFSLDLNSLKKASRMFWRIKTKGKEIDRTDILIATSFLENNVKKIITKNKKHFSQIKGLKVLDY